MHGLFSFSNTFSVAGAEKDNRKVYVYLYADFPVYRRCQNRKAWNIVNAAAIVGCGESYIGV